MIIEIKVCYPDPETGEPVNQTFQIFDDQLQSFLEHGEELHEATEGYR